MKWNLKWLTDLLLFLQPSVSSLSHRVCFSNQCFLRCEHIFFHPQDCCEHFFFILFVQGGGRNVEFHYYDWSFFSQCQKCLFSSSLLQNHYIKNVFLVHHYIKNHCLFSSSLLRKSERWKECEKEHQKSQFCLIFTFWLPMA